MKKVTIGEHVTTIRESSFEGCGLTNISLPSNITSIEQNAFKSNVNLEIAEYFGENKPARACVEVARLPKDVKVEIEVIAVI